MRKKIGIIYGGKSDEHEISIRSATSVIKNLDTTLFEPICIGITKKGEWLYTNNEIAVNLETKEKNWQNIHFSMSDKRAECYLGSIDNVNSKKRLDIDVIFPVLHGQYGEDGRMQGMFEILNIPYVGVDVCSASLSMNKYLTKVILEREGVPIVPFVHIGSADYNLSSVESTVKSIGYPCIVKPVNLGSSVGVTKVNTAVDLLAALEKAFSFDTGVLIERFIEGVELEIAVLEVDGVACATPPGKIILSDRYEFYDYTSKYEDKQSIEVELPAKLEEDTLSKMKELALRSFKVLRARHFVRIDMFLNKNNKIYVNEINPIPGFTDASMFPSLCAELGYDYKSLLTHIINQA